jgi:glycosyltransferase involved in cell wall biosynthesis
MKIGIDAHSAERDGTGNCTYTQNLILHLTKLDSKNEYLLFVTDRNHPFYKEVEEIPNIRIVQIRRSPAWWRVFISLRRATYREKIDILHIQYFAPFTHRGCLVNTVHDLASFRFPEHFSLFERLMFQYLLPGSARKASLIFTASRTSKEDLVTLMRLPEEKIRVAYCGVSERFFSSIRDPETIRNVCAQYGLVGKFILYVGRIDPRKNITRLIQAYSDLRDKKLIDHKLAIVGKVHLEPEKLQSTLERSNYRDDVHLCGYVSDEHLPVLYSAADVFVYTSEFEGFGLPPLEAMACGTPVVASDISIFREILGDAALLVNPFDMESISSGIYKILSDDLLRNALIEKGRSRVRKFTWENTASVTLQGFQDAVKESS